MVPNPWQVESIQAFYFLKCPECAFDTQDENYFQDHALENHPLSCALFEIKSNEDIIENSTYQEHDEDSLASAENRNSPSQNSTIDIKEKFRVDENEPLGFNNPIKNDGEEFLDERNVSLPETFAEPKKFEGNQNRQNKSSPVLECSICDANFTQRGKLNRHISTVHEKKKPFKCSICDCSFSSKHYMNTHVASVHGGKKPFKCSECYSSFSMNSDLKRHIASVHEKKKPFKCSKCDSNFSARQVLNRHMKRKH